MKSFGRYPPAAAGGGCGGVGIVKWDRVAIKKFPGGSGIPRAIQKTARVAIKEFLRDP